MSNDWGFIEDEFVCSVCGDENCVPPAGANKSKILFVGEFPGKIEISKGKPMVGPMGMVLRKELGYLGLDLRSVRRCNLWQHKPNKRDDCLDNGMKVVLKEAKGRDAIMLMGSELTKVFLQGQNIIKIAGLRVKSPFSAKLVMAMPNPAIVFHGGVGEVRLSLKKFVDNLKEEKII